MSRTWSSSCFISLASEALSGVNAPAIVMTMERRKKARIVNTLLTLEEEVLQKLKAN